MKVNLSSCAVAAGAALGRHRHGASLLGSVSVYWKIGVKGVVGLRSIHVVSAEPKVLSSSLSRENVVEITFSDGHKSQFHTTWLVDHDPTYTHPSSLQRQLDSASPDTNTALPNRISLTNNNNSLTLHFNNKDITYNTHFLRTHSYSHNKPLFHTPLQQQQQLSSIDLNTYFSNHTLWDATSMNKAKLPTFQYKDLSITEKNSALHKQVIKTMDMFGCMLVKSMDEASEKVEVSEQESRAMQYTMYANERSKNLKSESVKQSIVTERLVRQLFGCPRETFYGRMWDTAPKGSGEVVNDTAYTKDALDVHTDGCYWFDMPGLQVFNCIAQSGQPKAITEAGDGLDGEGSTRILDGFKVMKELKEKAPESFEFMLSHKLKWFSKEENVFMQNMGVPFQLNMTDEDNSGRTLFRYNTYDLAPLDYLSFNQVSEFYKHNKVVCSHMRSEKNVVLVRLEVGDMLIINNQRVCHGRNAYTGYRNMVGCYIGKDDWISQVRLL